MELDFDEAAEAIIITSDIGSDLVTNCSLCMRFFLFLFIYLFYLFIYLFFIFIFTAGGTLVLIAPNHDHCLLLPKIYFEMSF